MRPRRDVWALLVFWIAMDILATDTKAVALRLTSSSVGAMEASFWRWSSLTFASSARSLEVYEEGLTRGIRQ